MSDLWKYSKNGQIVGPVPASELEAALRAGFLSSDDMVWHESLGCWRAIKEIEQLLTPVEATVAAAAAADPAGTTGTRWRYSKDGVVSPYVTRDHIASLLFQGGLNDDDQVWSDELGCWQPLGCVSNLLVTEAKERPSNTSDANNIPAPVIAPRPKQRQRPRRPTPSAGDGVLRPILLGAALAALLAMAFFWLVRGPSWEQQSKAALIERHAQAKALAASGHRTRAADEFRAIVDEVKGRNLTDAQLVAIVRDAELQLQAGQERPSLSHSKPISRAAPLTPPLASVGERSHPSRRELGPIPLAQWPNPVVGSAHYSDSRSTKTDPALVPRAPDTLSRFEAAAGTSAAAQETVEQPHAGAPRHSESSHFWFYILPLREGFSLSHPGLRGISFVNGASPKVRAVANGGVRTGMIGIDVHVVEPNTLVERSAASFSIGLVGGRVNVQSVQLQDVHMDLTFELLDAAQKRVAMLKLVSPVRDRTARALAEASENKASAERSLQALAREHDVAVELHNAALVQARALFQRYEGERNAFVREALLDQLLAKSGVIDRQKLTIDECRSKVAVMQNLFAKSSAAYDAAMKKCIQRADEGRIQLHARRTELVTRVAELEAARAAVQRRLDEADFKKRNMSAPVGPGGQEDQSETASLRKQWSDRADQASQEMERITASTLSAFKEMSEIDQQLSTPLDEHHGRDDRQ